MKNLAVSEIMAGANFWDAPGHSMAGSNDIATRRLIFSWIKAHENTFYKPRTTIAPIGVYFSNETRNYYADQFIASYRGILVLLMQKHLEFQVVTPRTLAQFHGPTLVLPDVRIMSEEERDLLRKFVDGGKTLVITGEDATQLRAAANIVRFSKCPGKDYYAALEKSVADSTPHQEQEFLNSLKAEPTVQVMASPMIATSIARVEGKTHIFFANFAGLEGGVNPVQTPQTDVRVTVSGAKSGRGFFLPFLGDVRPLSGTTGDDGITFKLPVIEKGAVFWYEP
jgi:hypothetical protein